MVLRELFNSSLSKVRSYVINEKTAHWASKFCVCWRGSDRVGETHSSFKHNTIDGRLSWSHYLTDVKKNFVHKLNLLKRSSFLRRKALLDLCSKIILPSFLYGLGCFGADALMRTFYIHCKYLTVG